jgi:hypothetical protein
MKQPEGNKGSIIELEAKKPLVQEENPGKSTMNESVSCHLGEETLSRQIDSRVSKIRLFSHEL